MTAPQTKAVLSRKKPPKRGKVWWRLTGRGPSQERRHAIRIKQAKPGGGSRYARKAVLP